MRITTFCLAALLLVAADASAAQLDADAINGAKWRGSTQDQALLVKAQVLLDRANFSPGEIDGRAGDNFRKALSAFARERGLDASDRLSEQIWRELTTTSSDPVVIEHRLSEKDVAGPFLDKIPAKLEDMQGLPALSYASAREKIAEQFHMSEELLSTLNPGEEFRPTG